MTPYQKMYLLHKFTVDTADKQRISSSSTKTSSPPAKKPTPSPPQSKDKPSKKVEKDELKAIVKETISFMKNKRTPKLSFMQTPIEPLYYAIRHYKSAQGKTYTILDHMNLMKRYHNCDMVYVPFVLNKGSTRAPGINSRGFVQKDSVIGQMIQNVQDNEHMLIKVLKGHYEAEWTEYLSYLPVLFMEKSQMNTAVPGYKVADAEFERHYKTAYRQAKEKRNREFIIYLVNYRRWKFNKSSHSDSC